MSKTLFIYESKKGMTEKLINKLHQLLDEGEVYHIDDFNGDLESYDRIIIGSPIYVGHINKKIKKWIQSHHSILLNKKTGVCLCGMNDKEEDVVIQNNFTEDEQNHFVINYLGGAYRFDKLNFFQKFIIKKITGETESREVIHHEKIKYFMSAL